MSLQGGGEEFARLYVRTTSHRHSLFFCHCPGHDYYRRHWDRRQYFWGCQLGPNDVQFRLYGGLDDDDFGFDCVATRCRGVPHCLPLQSNRVHLFASRLSD